MSKFRDHRLALLLAGVAATLAIYTPLLFAAPHHELAAAGSDWFRLNLVPLVQSYTHYGPFAVVIGSFYSTLSNLQVLLVDAAVAAATVLMTYMLALRLKQSKHNALASGGLMLLAMFSGFWQYGADSYKYGLLLSVFTVLMHICWKTSGKSYWLFGETQHNWRFGLLSGLGFGLAAFAEPVFAIVVIPIVYDVLRSSGVTKTILHTGYYAIPFMAHAWIWLSYFSSRSLTREWINAAFTHTEITVTGGLRTILPVVLLPGVVVVLGLLWHARRERYTAYKSAWLLALGLLLSIAITPRLAASTLPLYILALTCMQLPTILLKAMRPKWFIAIGILACSMHIVTARQQSDYETASYAVVPSMTESAEVTQIGILGNGAGFYKPTLLPSTRFYDTRILSYSPQLIDYYRGDSEASLAKFYVIQKEAESSAPTRLSDYVETHYQQIYEDDSYRLLERTTNL